MNVHRYICISAEVLVCIHVCVFVYIGVYMYMSAGVYVYVCIWTHMCTLACMRICFRMARIGKSQQEILDVDGWAEMAASICILMCITLTCLFSRSGREKEDLGKCVGGSQASAQFVGGG